MNVCECGREFAKAFGMRVHQRTCAEHVRATEEDQ